jgi:hypothetical protein
LIFFPPGNDDAKANENTNETENRRIKREEYKKTEGKKEE